MIYAVYYASYLDEVEDVQAVYDEIIEVANEAIAAAKEKDSAEVRDIAIDFRDDYYGKYRDCQEMSLEYGDKFGELDDEYGDKLMTAVSGVYSSAIMSADKEYMEYQDKDSLDCNLDINDLEDKYDF